MQREDGTFDCPPPPKPQGCTPESTEPRCNTPPPPPNCKDNGDGTFNCDPSKQQAQQFQGPPECQAPPGQRPKYCEGIHQGPPPDCKPDATGAPTCPDNRPRPPPGQEYCSPENPCRPPVPPGCTENADGSMNCRPPDECADSSEAKCAPPPWCAKKDDGSYDCKPPEHPPMMGGPSCAPADPAGDAPAPCGPPPPGFAPQGDCAPSPDGSMKCKPPADCGGGAWGGAGAQGCAPPSFCKQAEDGTFDCRPPEDCRVDESGKERCFKAAVYGAGCQAHLAHNTNDVANGAFAACAPPPMEFCVATYATGPNAEAKVEKKCGDIAPPPMRFCAPGEAQFGPNHPRGAPPACVLGSGFANGKYVPPSEHFKGKCTPPPPGEWPPAEPAPADSVWCPPEGFAPPPPPDPKDPAAFEAWKVATKAKLPPQALAAFEAQSKGWEKLDETTKKQIHDRALAAGMFGETKFDGRSFEGAFVGGTTDPEKFSLQNYKVGGVKFFNGAQPKGIEDKATTTTAIGGSVILTGENTIVETHNTGPGHVLYKAADKPYTVDLDLDPAVKCKKEGVLLVCENGNWKAALAAEQATIGADGKVTLNVDPENPGVFMAIEPGDELEAESRIDIAEGVAQGTVGAEALISIGEDGAVPEVISYDDVTIEVVPPDRDGADAEGALEELKLKVESETHDAEVVFFEVARADLAIPLADLEVSIDGKVLVEADDLQALIDAPLDAQSAETACVASAEGVVEGEGSFSVLADEATIRIGVCVAGFSEHEIKLSRATERVVEEQRAAAEAWSFEEETTDETEPTGETTDDSAEASTDMTQDETTTTTGGTDNAPPASTPGFTFWGAFAAVAVAGLMLGTRRRRN